MQAMKAIQHRTMIVWLAGGLGNQLFQFAFGRALASKAKTQVLFDPTSYSDTTAADRRYLLGKFELNVPLLRQRPKINFDKKIVRIRRPLRMDIRYSPVKSTFRLIQEKKDYTFDPNVLSHRGACFFRGFWQAQEYVAICIGSILADIRLPFSELDTAGRAWLTRIRNSNAVAMHVRRGDYLDSHIHSIHGLCDVRYYTAAMSLMRKRTPAAEFFVFSDDPGWCRQALGIENVHIVDVHSPDLGHLDMALMASCRHHVIANSSFSWWGACLGQHEKQIVVAPTPWTTQEGSAPDMFPPGWIVLDRATGEGPS
jgi:glycosyl transferase family 11